VSILVALVMVPTISALVHGDLALWLHIPLTGLALAAMAGGAAATGVALVEYRARMAQPAQQSK